MKANLPTLDLSACHMIRQELEYISSQYPQTTLIGRPSLTICDRLWLRRVFHIHLSLFLILEKPRKLLDPKFRISVRLSGCGFL